MGPSAYILNILCICKMLEFPVAQLDTQNGAEGPFCHLRELASRPMIVLQRHHEKEFRGLQEIRLEPNPIFLL